MSEFNTTDQETTSTTTANKAQEIDDKKWQYPLVRRSDLPEETEPEIIEMITGVLERYYNDLQTACKLIKEKMDKVYGPHWNCICGEAFGFDVVFLKKHILYMFFSGSLGILVWKNC